MPDLGSVLTWYRSMIHSMAERDPSWYSYASSGMHDAARRFLAEFGAVGVPHRDPSDSMPWMEFSLDPLLAIWDAEIIDDLAEQAGVDLYPLGMRDRGNQYQYLAMAEDGAVYAGMDDVRLLAPTPDEALRGLTTRIRPEATP
ncbi:SUKH-3 domain-containing protein [Streptomyces sp. NPDC059454]|uniref:SUKH-3 domain-containing protein n=1 Tax=Streptomyces sp. NPDC059454 TaxID=3346836 RepID=UPI0036CAC301